jgi:hypothetical protein
MYGNDYLTGYYDWKGNYANDEAYIWPLSDGYAVLKAGCGSMEDAKTSSGSFSVYFYRELPPQYVIGE